jgi:hypothetical protein
LWAKSGKVWKPWSLALRISCARFHLSAEEVLEVTRRPQEKCVLTDGGNRHHHTEVIDGRHDGLHDLSFGLELLLEGLEQQRQG